MPTLKMSLLTSNVGPVVSNDNWLKIWKGNDRLFQAETKLQYSSYLKLIIKALNSGMIQVLYIIKIVLSENYQLLLLVLYCTNITTTNSGMDSWRESIKAFSFSPEITIMEALFYQINLCSPQRLRYMNVGYSRQIMIGLLCCTSGWTGRLQFSSVRELLYFRDIFKS